MINHSIFIQNSYIILKAKAYFELLKVKLTSLVIFSAGFGFVLSEKNEINISKLIFTLLGGFLMTGAANILNQVMEVELDKMMVRTSKRPLPEMRLSMSEALAFCLILSVTGFMILISAVNVAAAYLTFVSVLLYAFLYTPMKRISSFSVLVGAFPGAMPPLIGWVANTGHISTEALVIFALQFIWQFPHFWAIAWMLDDDYKRAGFKMMPSSGGKDIRSAFQIAVYTFFLIPMGILPYMFKISGIYSAVVISICGLWFFYKAIVLMNTLTVPDARRIMFASIIYLPVVQIALILDKV
ncbi:MAG: heme o synthase [Cytophagales bacterium]|nr:heme o synthase [Cytophagales bacterium]